MLAVAASVVDVALRSRDDGIDPDASGRIGSGLQMVAALLRLDDERAVGPAALRRVHVIEVHLVDCLSDGTKTLLSSSSVYYVGFPLETHRKIGTTSWLALRLVREVDQRHFLPIEQEPAA